MAQNVTISSPSAGGVYVNGTSNVSGTFTQGNGIPQSIKVTVTNSAGLSVASATVNNPTSPFSISLTVPAGSGYTFTVAYTEDTPNTVFDQVQDVDVEN